MTIYTPKYLKANCNRDKLCTLQNPTIHDCNVCGRTKIKTFTPAEEAELIQFFSKALEQEPIEFIDVEEERADYRLHTIREGI